jgi:hypothetical protein
MPESYVQELQSYPARPRVVRPTTVVHGRLDADEGGSAPWRIEEWGADQPFQRVLLLPGVDHSLEPWLTADDIANAEPESQRIPTLNELVAELVSD